MDTAVAARAPVSAAGPLVEISHVRHVYDDHIVLEDVDLQLRSNEIVALLLSLIHISEPTRRS